MKARILTSWIGDGSSVPNSHRPKIADDFIIKSWEDVTNQPVSNIYPSPNLYMIEIVCTDAIFAAIQASAEYGDGIISTVDDEDDIPDVAAFNKLRNHLKNKGTKITDLDDAVGKNPGGRKKKQVAEQLKNWLKNLPKGP